MKFWLTWQSCAQGNASLLAEVMVWSSRCVVLAKGFVGEQGELVRARNTVFPFPLDLQDTVCYSSHTASLAICHRNRKHFDT